MRRGHSAREHDLMVKLLVKENAPWVRTYFRSYW